MTFTFRLPARCTGAERALSCTRQFATILIAACAISTGASAQIVTRSTGPASATESALVKTEQVQAELFAHAPDGISAGKTVWLGLQIRHQPHWHTYWKNPGDSGLPTVLQWSLPAGVTAGEIAWPTPQRIAIGNLANYGFGDTILLPTPLAIDKAFQPTPGGDLEVRLSASWLVCRQECIPQDGNFVLRVPAKGSTASHGGDFEATRAASPTDLPGTSAAKLVGNSLTVTVSGLPASWHGRALQTFPETTNIAEPVTSPQTGDTAITGSDARPSPGKQVWQAGVWSGSFPLSVQREGTTDKLPIVLALGAQSLRTVAAVSGTWPALGSASTTPIASVIQPGGNAATGTPATTSGGQPLSLKPTGWSSWMLAIGAALLGGMILNLMPCVLPVLAIKVLGFSRHSEHSPASQRAQGLAYTLGVVLSFVSLGALMLALRATGEQLGWGFQLQSPTVVALLAALFTLLGLNLAGLFEVGSLLPHSVASLQARHPVVDAFLSGVLAVAIASPCTAPFMGASLGYAISLPAAQALGIFAALGLGLALPFLAAAWIPAFGHMLPRPGAWMDTLRRFMAFPMLATVIWLVWVLGHLSGVDGAGALLALLLGMALVVWSLGLSGRSRLILATLSIATLAGLTGAIGPLAIQMDETGTAAARSDPSGPVNSNASATWQAWAPGRVEAELAAGHPVFVDFTAAWCITCQYNKKTTLSNTQVLADMRAHKVTLLRADWTRRDPAITVALEQLGRSGVPVYVLHQLGKPVVVFSEILDAQELRNALSAL